MPVEHYDGSSSTGIEQLQFGADIEEGLYWDGEQYHTVYQPLGVLDDFEHNDIPGFYSDPSGTGTVDTSTQAAYEGDYGAHFDGFRNIWSQPGDGLEQYYEPNGEWAELFFRPLAPNTGTHHWFAFGDGNTDGWDNHYEIQVIPGSDTFRVQRRDDGRTTVLADDGTNVDYSTQWYRVTWMADAEENEIRARLYDSSGTRLENLQADEDPTRGGSWSWPGKLGLRCGSDGEVYIDEIRYNPSEGDA